MANKPNTRLGTEAAERMIDLRTQGRTYREIADEIGVSVEMVRDRIREFTAPRYTFGDTVRELRKARGWSQEDLARYMTDAEYPMHQTTIAKLENGARPTSVDELVALSRVLDVPPARLVPAEDRERGEVREALSRLQAINAEVRALDVEIARLQQRHRSMLDERQSALDVYFDALRKVKLVAQPLSDAVDHVRALAEIERATEAQEARIRELFLAEFTATEEGSSRAAAAKVEERAQRARERRRGGEHQEAP